MYAANGSESFEVTPASINSPEIVFNISNHVDAISKSSGFNSVPEIYLSVSSICVLAVSSLDTAMFSGTSSTALGAKASVAIKSAALFCA